LCENQDDIFLLGWSLITDYYKAPALFFAVIRLEPYICIKLGWSLISDRMKIYGIITGDVVSSREIDAFIRKKLFEDMGMLLKGLKKQWIYSYETYRGDSLQCEVRSPELSLRVGLIIRCFFRAYFPDELKPKTVLKKRKKLIPSKGYFATNFDVRLGIGIGSVDFIKRNKITGSDGEAFQLSGDALDDLKQSAQRMAIKTFDPALNEQMEPSLLLLDALIQKWTQNQAELVLYKLQDKKEEEIAATLKITQSAVNQRTKTAQWLAIEKLVQYFEKTVGSIA
jgi:predicted XRE-type DNA-binding protein